MKEKVVDVSSKRKIIKSVDDLEREKQALFREVGFNSEGRPQDESETVD